MSVLRRHALALATGAVVVCVGAGPGIPSARASDLTRPPTLDRPPPGYRLSANRAIAIASALPKVRAARRGRSGTYPVGFEKAFGRWQVSFFARGGKEIAQVYLDDASGRVTEQWTGFQVAWTMARGYPGAFGRKSNTLWLWLVLSVLFVVPFVDRRRLISMRHLDLVALSCFSVSLAFFNRANIDASVPLAYPPLLYMLVRMLWLARRGVALEPLRLLVPISWLAVATVFLAGFRIGLNVTDSNVIDVGYAGVIGADHLIHGKRIYGAFPKDNEHGDTYGPFNYEAYVPAVAIAGWSGRWDDLPAAHLAACAFDLLCMVGLFLLGRRVRGPTLGVAMAYAWAAWPFTLFALSSDTNDTLVGLLLVGALLAAGRPALRGGLAALAGLTKLAPLALAPLLASHRDPQAAAGVHARRWPTTRFAAGFALACALAFAPVLIDGGISHLWDRTVAYQATRGSPFSIWGLYGGLGGLQGAVQVAGVLFAAAAAFLPRRPGLTGLAAMAAAVLIVLQLGVTHWFYLYLVWFFPLALLALLDGGARTGAEGPGPSAGRGHQDLLDRPGTAAPVGRDHDAHQPGVVV